MPEATIGSFKHLTYLQKIFCYPFLNTYDDIAGTNDAYAIAIIFAMLLSKTDTKEFVSAMKSAFGKLAKELHTISVDDVMKIMGYSSSWANLTNLK